MKITKDKLKQIIKEELEALEKTDGADDQVRRPEPNNPPLRRMSIDEDDLHESLRLIMAVLSKTKDPLARLPRGKMPPMWVEARDMADEIMSGKMSLTDAIRKLTRVSLVVNPPAID